PHRRELLRRSPARRRRGRPRDHPPSRRTPAWFSGVIGLGAVLRFLAHLSIKNGNMRALLVSLLLTAALLPACDGGVPAGRDGGGSGLHGGPGGWGGGSAGGHAGKTGNGGLDGGGAGKGSAGGDGAGAGGGP